MKNDVVLSIDGLNLDMGDMRLLHDVTFAITRGETLGLVGESGAGKSLTGLAIPRLLPDRATLTGRIRLGEDQLLTLGASELNAIRGRRIGVVFQEPLTALNPLQKIGQQIEERYIAHTALRSSAARQAAESMLTKVGLAPSDAYVDRYPHQLSGGQRQRVVIALALALQPELIIADEPTSALDVVSECEVLELLARLCAQDNIALLFISHDLAAVARIAERVAVMHRGRLVELQATNALLQNPIHAASRALVSAARHASVQATRRADVPAERTVVLRAQQLTKCYRTQRSDAASTIVDAVDIELCAGQITALVGESGAGKSTLARLLLGLEHPDAGTVDIAGQRFAPAALTSQRSLRHLIQAVFQDPFDSFNPRMRVADIVAEPLALIKPALNAKEIKRRVAQQLQRVGLDGDVVARLPHEFSGGQRQRIAIARAMLVEPAVLILDEATSALDVIRRERILALVMRLAREDRVACLLITHDLDAVQYTADQVIVLRRGSVVERNTVTSVFNAPTSAYTQSLLTARLTLPPLTG